MERSEQTRCDFGEIRNRLDEIASQVRDDELPLDAALDLYDEAVKLGMKAAELLETVEEGGRMQSDSEPMSDDEEAH
ncbi:MAG: exodeoxyribonuclease VII small subunit [Slackia sp.]|nr:exodeoxyribonuclease VII small subunit [Slackia sp.]